MQIALIKLMMMKNFLCDALQEISQFQFPSYLSQQQSEGICSISLFLITLIPALFFNPYRRTSDTFPHDSRSNKFESNKEWRVRWRRFEILRMKKLYEKWKHSFASINIYDVLHSIASSTWNIPYNTSLCMRPSWGWLGGVQTTLSSREIRVQVWILYVVKEKKASSSFIFLLQSNTIFIIGSHRIELFATELCRIYSSIMWRRTSCSEEIKCSSFSNAIFLFLSTKNRKQMYCGVKQPWTNIGGEGRLSLVAYTMNDCNWGKIVKNRCVWK